MRAERLTFMRISPGRSSWRTWRRSAVRHPWKGLRDDTSVGGWNPATASPRGFAFLPLDLGPAQRGGLLGAGFLSAWTRRGD